MTPDKTKHLQELITLFKNNIKQYKSSSYDEANTRVDFIDKFFELLDWDVRNIKGASEQYRDVVREDKVLIEGKQKAPDYSFRIGETRKFFVEAKKPSINIKDDIEPAFQIRRYAYTAKLPLSILTDFEEIAIYDTRIKPDKNDKASNARVFYCTYEDWFKPFNCAFNRTLKGTVENAVEKSDTNFDFIYNTFSKDAILKGSFDKYIQENKNKKGTSEVDKEFLKLIETWRAELAKNIALRNLDLTIYELNYAVQKIIDRIIFLRIAEDKQMESYGNLIKLVENSDIYKSFNNLVENADNKYNSGLFDKKDFLFDLSIDDKILKSIFKSLYYPDCPYVFSVLGIEILGNIYEQFLGKTVRLTSSHQAKVEEKPEVKKAGGVYYTPQYIVDYIVYNTVGELIKNKKPQEIEEVKILDPACGSGSFLIGAYNYLLKYHIEYYTNEKNIKKALKEEKIYQLSENDYKLTIQEKQHILLNNIYGLDLDNQAVEVTKLSLLLKLLEAENQESSNSLFKYTDIKLLPDLSNNIKSGNSLINSSIFQDKDISLFEDEKLKTINVFDWNKEFAQIINPPQSPFDKGENKGGFDVVIGNPPYVKEYTDTEQFHLVKQSNLKKYYQGKMDLWYMFGCLSIDLLKDGGIHSFIATNNWITSAGASILRNKILNETKIIKFIDFADYKVFNTASIQTMIYIFKKVKNDKSYKVNYTKLLNKNISESELADWMNKKISLHKDKNTNNFEWFDASINPKELADKTITFVNNEINKILEKMNNKSNYKFDNNNVGTGIDVHQDFIIDKHLEKLKDKNIKKGDGIFVISHNEKKSLGLSDLEESIIKPYYTTENLFKYYGDPNNNLWVIYSNIEVRTNINNYPNIKKHLDKYKNVITSDFKPYGLHRAREQKFFEGDKIISLRKTSAPTFTYTTFPCYVSQTYFIIKPQDINLKYLTAFLNSKLVHFWLYYKGKKQGDQLQIDKAPLLEIPLIKIDDKKLIDKFIELVDNMIESNKKLHCAKLDSDKKMYQQKIDAIDNQINKLVYNLYGLNDEEIKVIESSV